MFGDQKHSMTEVSRRDAEPKLIKFRNKFLGYLRKRLNSPQDAEDVFQDFCVKVPRCPLSRAASDWTPGWAITLRHNVRPPGASIPYRRQSLMKEMSMCSTASAPSKAQDQKQSRGCCGLSAGAPKSVTAEPRLLRQMSGSSVNEPAGVQSKGCCGRH